MGWWDLVRDRFAATKSDFANQSQFFLKLKKPRHIYLL